MQTGDLTGASGGSTRRGGGQGRRPSSGLRPNVLAAIVMLLVQFSLGIGVNLYASLPASDHGKGLFPAFGHSVADGPVVLSLHALLGTLIVGTGVGALARSIRAGLVPQASLAGLALIAILVAWLSGSSFVGDQRNGASLSMALAAVAAILCYTIVLFMTPASIVRRAAAGSPAASLPTGQS